ncbi:TetR/AcrR family transcriptional regulator [Dongia soli]|uniref:TetR family transcriptional regulator n=1 Tax=Dongia soli TaxID=600628 RepID=A0ABU5ECJ8_9PROT|nr:TetR family transcriptional regulator [Dongia soli]MDY0883524.1 TetR family transcriptional regulator [Dongia soli]
MKQKRSHPSKQHETSYNRLDSASRQRQLIEATSQVIVKVGISGVTLQRVAEVADITAGMVNFHFKSKDALLKATLESLVSDYIEQLASALEKAATSPAESLRIIAEQHFSAPLMTRDKLTLWYAYWGETQAHGSYRQICSSAKDFLHDLINNLVMQLQAPNGNTELARAITAGFIGIISHLSQEYFAAPERVDLRASIATCLAYLAHAFPEHGFEKPKDDRQAAQDTSDDKGANRMIPAIPMSPDWVVATLRDIDLNLARGIALQDICRRQHLDLKMIDSLRRKFQGMSAYQIRYVMTLENRNLKLMDSLADQLTAKHTARSTAARRSRKA